MWLKQDAIDDTIHRFHATCRSMSIKTCSSVDPCLMNMRLLDANTSDDERVMTMRSCFCASLKHLSRNNLHRSSGLFGIG